MQNQQGATMLNNTPNTPLSNYRGAPRALTLKKKTSAGVYQPFPSNLKFTAKLDGSTLFELVVGQGLTLLPYNGVADAMVVVLWTPAQSLLAPLGSASFYELVQGAVPSVICRGPFVSQGL
jgi:hypothetical protein